MTATLAGSAAALKILYPKGEIPKVVHKQFKTIDRLKKSTDFVGESQYVALQNENPQGSSADFATALGSLQQGTYNRFNLTRVEHFGIARIKGQAAEAAVKTEGALVDLWENETKGISMTEMKCLGIYIHGTGDGTLGTISSGETGATITLTSAANMNYFDLGMRVGAVSATGLSPTVRSGSARLSGIDRVNRTITTAGGNFNVQITVLGSTDLLVRAGDNAAAGTANVITGFGGYVVGGTSPGTLFGLNRDTDPTRLAGQTYSAAGVDMGDAVVEASALGGFQGVGYADVLICNNREVANMKKAAASKIMYTNGGGTAAHSFSKVTIEGEDGPIEVIADPFCPRNTAKLLKWDAFTLHSLGSAPHLQNYDSNNFLRVASDDAFEVRFVTYGNTRCNNPAPHVAITSFGL